MKGQVINLNRERWLALANLALEAAADPALGDKLGLAAAGMQAATPSSTERYAMALCLSFRWGCQAFGFAAPIDRIDLTASLTVLAKAVRNLFDPAPAGPEAAAMPAPLHDADVEALEPAWMRRADLR